MVNDYDQFCNIYIKEPILKYYRLMDTFFYIKYMKFICKCNNDYETKVSIFYNHSCKLNSLKYFLITLLNQANIKL